MAAEIVYVNPKCPSLRCTVLIFERFGKLSFTAV